MDAQEFQKAQKVKLLACYGETPESLIEKAQVEESDDLEKGGEGSKGGKIIGHTKSGKAIYENPHHESHKEFTKQDHIDARDLHDREMSKIEPNGPGGGTTNKAKWNRHSKGYNFHQATQSPEKKMD